MIQAINTATTPKINSQINNNNIRKKSYQTSSQQDTKAQINYTGLDTLSNYNQMIINKPTQKIIKPSLPTVLQPEAIKVLKGDRIYNSTGTLNSIITRNDKTTTIYKMDVLAPQDAIGEIKTFDNKTGKLIRTQKNLNTIEENKLPRTDIIEIKDYSTDFPKPLKTTIYYKGKLEMVAEHEYGPNNYSKFSVISNTESPKVIEENFKAQGIRKTTKFDAQGNIFSVDYINSNDESKKTIYYKNGLPSKIINESKSPIENLTGINPQNDITIKPSLPFILNYNPMTLAGERNYYSNGMVEGIKTKTSNDGGYILHKFGLNGTLEGILDMSNPNNKKNILFFPNYYTIEENTANNIRKTTIFNEDGTKEVSLYDKNDNIQKYAAYFQNGNLASYLETLPDGTKTLMNYDKNGNLINIS